MINQAELIRVYFRAAIAIFFMACFGYVLMNHVGLKPGEIAPDVIYSWLTGLIMGFIAFYFAGEAIQK
jgi:hypothetical protein|tara:strand:+ start:5130 stop:5333 length:204 start_codon:yes stop_codon:yes gene_type:complete